MKIPKDNPVFLIPGKYPMSDDPGIPWIAGWYQLLNSITKFAETAYLHTRVINYNGQDWEDIIEKGKHIPADDYMHLSSLTTRGKANIEPFKSDINKPVGIHTVFVNDIQLNAFAIRLPKSYFVCINMGTIFLFCRYFNELVKSPSFFPDIEGDNAEENGEKIEFTTFHPKFVPQHLTMQEAQAWAMCIDKDLSRSCSPKRFILAELLTFLSLRLIIAHEVSHIVCGHCDMASSLEVLSLNDIETEENISSSYIDRKTRMIWEAEADIVSIDILVSFLRPESLREDLGKYFAVIGLKDDIQTVTGLYILCLRVVYNMWGNIQGPIGQNEVHPHCSARLYAMRQVMTEIHRAKGIDPETFYNNYWDKYKTDIDVALNAIPYRSAPNKGDIVKFTEHQLNQMDELLVEMVNERHRWEEFSLIKF